MEAPPRILVIRLSSLGDVVLTGPVYRNLRDRWPDARIAVLTKPAFAPFLVGHPAVDEVLPFHNLFSAVRLVRRRRFTHVLDLHSNWRSFWLAFLSGAEQRARYRKDALARRLFVWAGRTSPRLERHTLDRYLEALGAWGVPVRHRSPELRDWQGPPPPGGAFRRILVVQTAFLGDAVLTLPLLRASRRAFPEARIEVLARPDTAELFRSEGADAVIEDEKRSGPLALWRLARRLRRFDLALVPHRSLRSALLAWLARIPRRVGFNTSAGRWLLTDAVPFTWLVHDAERNLSLLRPVAGAVRLEPGPAGPQGSAAPAKAAGPEALAGLRGPLVGMHPGSVWPTKRWLPSRFAEVARRLREELGATVLLVGGEGDRALAEEVAAASGALNWAGRTSLKGLMELMPRLSLFITNDSGPMHVATSCGVPTLAVFGPTTRELGFFPYGEGHRVLEADLPCRPCGLHGSRACPEGHFLCMRLITADQVLEAARDLLRRRREVPA